MDWVGWDDKGLVYESVMAAATFYCMSIKYQALDSLYVLRCGLVKSMAFPGSQSKSPEDLGPDSSAWVSSLWVQFYIYKCNCLTIIRFLATFLAV